MQQRPKTSAESGVTAGGRGPGAGSYHVVTLGCKLNRFDSATAEGILRAGGYAPTDDPRRADVILLNTCTVTSRADADGRRLARRMRRLNSSARIVATGCYAEREPEALRALGVLDDVVGLAERTRLPEALLGETECVTGPLWLQFEDRARAFLRVQEGCDLSCSYCVIPSVRGPGRSVPRDLVSRQVRAIADAGVREICLTGVNTGSWGRDLEPRRRLADLLEGLLGLGLPLRYRLNSLEPKTVDERILGLMAAAPERLVPHVQIPLQNGSDRILARMSRNYRSSFYERLVERVVGRVPDVSVGADVITGFPGETDDDFAATERLIERLPLAYLHVFTYSPRPGTRATRLVETSDTSAARLRTRRLRELSGVKARAFRERMLGRVLEALVLSDRAADGSARALTGNYIEILVPQANPGTLVPVRLERLTHDGRLALGRVEA
jgi:threonylcarbamoyladenosine tRNA methylthiotransferase MtaB